MSLIVEGRVRRRLELTAAELLELDEQVTDIAELVPGRSGGGVWLRSLLAAAGADDDARWARLGSADGAFRISVPLDALRERGLVVYRLGDGDLPVDKGGPMRLFIVDVPECGTAPLDACANVKGLGRIELSSDKLADVGHEPH